MTKKTLKHILVTGTAGFIGYHAAEALLAMGHVVTGLDNINDYYDPTLKYARLEEAGIKKETIAYGKPATSEKHPNYRFIKMNLEDREQMERLFLRSSFEVVIHLAAQAGVRYSLEHPEKYIDSNIVGFLNILEGCKHSEVQHLIFASSSSVYGMNRKMPFSERDNVDHPVSLYAATKKSNELMAHTYSHLFGLPTTGLRFFTVYGPWGRPDMAYFLFTEAIEKGEPIKVFNQGQMSRDFTYIDDIVKGLLAILDIPPRSLSEIENLEDKPHMSTAPYRLYNIGNNQPIQLKSFVREIEEALGKKAEYRLLPMQPGDVEATYADIELLQEVVGFKPETSLREGIGRFVKWWREYHRTDS